MTAAMSRPQPRSVSHPKDQVGMPYVAQIHRRAELRRVGATPLYSDYPRFQCVCGFHSLPTRKCRASLQQSYQLATMRAAPRSLCAWEIAHRSGWLVRRCLAILLNHLAHTRSASECMDACLPRGQRAGLFQPPWARAGSAPSMTVIIGRGWSRLHRRTKVT